MRRRPRTRGHQLTLVVPTTTASTLSPKTMIVKRPRVDGEPSDGIVGPASSPPSPVDARAQIQSAVRRRSTTAETRNSAMLALKAGM